MATSNGERYLNICLSTPVVLDSQTEAVLIALTDWVEDSLIQAKEITIALTIDIKGLEASLVSMDPIYPSDPNPWSLGIPRATHECCVVSLYKRQQTFEVRQSLTIGWPCLSPAGVTMTNYFQIIFMAVVLLMSSPNLKLSSTLYDDTVIDPMWYLYIVDFVSCVGCQVGLGMQLRCPPGTEKWLYVQETAIYSTINPCLLLAGWLTALNNYQLCVSPDEKLIICASMPILWRPNKLSTKLYVALYSAPLHWVLLLRKVLEVMQAISRKQRYPVYRVLLVDLTIGSLH